MAVQDLLYLGALPCTEVHMRGIVKNYEHDLWNAVLMSDWEPFQQAL